MEELRTTDPRTEAPRNSFLVGIPLVASSEPAGAIVAHFEGLTRDELQLGSVRADVLGAFGVHAAAAIQNARTHCRTQSYSHVLEDWVEHTSLLMQVTDAISPSLSLDETLSELTNVTRTVMNADVCLIALPDRDGNLAVRSVSREDDDGLAAPIKFRPEQAESGMAFVNKQHVTCRDLGNSSLALSKKMAQSRAVRGMLSVPLLVKNEAIGTISIYTKEPGEFTPAEIRLLTSIGLHTAVIIRNAGLYTRQSSIAQAMQQGLIPQIPDCRWGLQFAGRYSPALDEARVGGDFYDVVELPNGKVGVVIGDVSGKGLAAAIHLATCKYMIKALMYEHPDDPGAVLRQLNDAMNHYFEMSFFVTVFYAVIDTANHAIHYANAGHPPAVLVSENHKMHTGLSATGTPVGTGYECRHDTRRVDFKPSDVLLLYTDGVIDTAYNGQPLDIEGLHKLIFRAGSCSARPLVEYLYEQLQGDSDSSQRDDMAALAISYEGVGDAGKTARGGTSGRSKRIATRTA